MKIVGSQVLKCLLLLKPDTSASDHSFVVLIWPIIDNTVIRWSFNSRISTSAINDKQVLVIFPLLSPFSFQHYSRFHNWERFLTAAATGWRTTAGIATQSFSFLPRQTITAWFRHFSKTLWFSVWGEVRGGSGAMEGNLIISIGGLKIIVFILKRLHFISCYMLYADMSKHLKRQSEASSVTRQWEVGMLLFFSQLAIKRPPSLFEPDVH